MTIRKLNQEDMPKWPWDMGPLDHWMKYICFRVQCLTKKTWLFSRLAQLLMVEGYANSDWFIFFSLCLSKNMGQSEFVSPSIIKSCAIWEKARKNLVKHWTLKQMICSSSAFFMCLCDCCVLAFLSFRESIN